MISQAVSFDLIDISEKILGKGYTATVFEGTHKETQEKFAVKKVDLEKIPNFGHENIMREINLQK